MSGVFIASLGGLSALLLWGISDWLTSKSSKEFSGREVNFAIQISGALIMLFALIISGHNVPTIGNIIVLMLAAMLFTVAYLCFIKALNVGQAGIVVPLANTYPLITLLASFILLTIAFTPIQVSAMLIIVCGAVLLGTEKINWRKLRKNFKRETSYAMGAAFFWGIGFFVTNTVVDKLPWQVILGVLSISMGVYALLLFFAKNRKEAMQAILRLPTNKTGIIAGVALTLGSVGFFIGAERSGSLIIPAVIAAGSPLITSILAAIFDKEKLTVIKRVGAVLVVFGVTLLNIS